MHVQAAGRCVPALALCGLLGLRFTRAGCTLGQLAQVWTPHVAIRDFDVSFPVDCGPQHCQLP